MRNSLSLLLLLAVFIPCYAQKTDLTLNLEKGKEYRQTVNSEATSVQELMGQKLEIAMKVENEIVYKVLNVSSSDCDLEVRYENMQIRAEQPHGSLDYSSENPDAQDLLSTMLHKLTGIVYNIKLSKNGQVLEIENLNSALEQMFDDLSHFPEAQLVPIKTQILSTYSEEVLKNSFELISPFYPDYSVGVGDIWDAATEVYSEMGLLAVTAEYELVELGDDFVRVKSISETATKNRDDYLETGGMEIKFDITGSTVSEFKLDRKTGWIIEANKNQVMEGNTETKGNPTFPGGMVIPIKVKTEVVITN